MSTESDMHARHSRVLAELAEAGLAIVRRLGDALADTDDVAAFAQVGLAFHRVSRSVRLTVALEHRLAHAPQVGDHADRASRRPEPASEPEERPEAAVAAERGERGDRREDERDEVLDAFDDLDALLTAEDLDLAAVDDTVLRHIARIRRDLALDPSVAGLLQAAPTVADHPRPTPPADRDRRARLLGAAALPGALGPPLPTRRSSA